MTDKQGPSPFHWLGMPLKLPGGGAILGDLLLAAGVALAAQVFWDLSPHAATGLLVTVWLCLLGVSAGAALDRYLPQTVSLALAAGIVGAGVSSLLESLSR